MNQQKLTEKEIKAYKLKTLLYLFLILILSVVAIWLFRDNQRVIREFKAQGITLESWKSKTDLINKQKLEMEEAISLLGILVNDENAEEMDPSYILANLSKLAEYKKSEIAQKNQKRADLISGIFSSNEDTRENSRRKLAKEYSIDAKLVGEVLDATTDLNFVNNQNSIWQIIFILTDLSDKILQDNKDKIEAFFVKVENNGLAASQTRNRMDMIRAVMNN